jgi:hypothetical protein
MNIRAASLCVAFAFAALPAHAQSQEGAAHPGELVRGHREAEDRDDGPALLARITELEGRVAKLEGHITAADLAGTYSFHLFESELDAAQPGRPAKIRSSVAAGTVMLAADGTGSITFAEQQIALAMDLLSSDAGTLTGNLTWTFAGGIVSLSLGGEDGEIAFSVAAGGHLLVGAAADVRTTFATGTASLLLLTR